MLVKASFFYALNGDFIVKRVLKHFNKITGSNTF